MQTQTFTNRSNAARAARKACAAAGVSAPLSGVHFQITESAEKPGEYGYILIDAATGETTRSFKPAANLTDDPGAVFDSEMADALASVAQAVRTGRDDPEPPTMADHAAALRVMATDFVGTPGERLAREVERNGAVAQVDVAALPAPPAAAARAARAEVNRASRADRAPAKKAKASAPAKAPRKAKAAAPAPQPAGKRAAVQAAAEAGQVPPAPDFSAETHKRYRIHLAKAVELVAARDVAGLKALTFSTAGSSGKALDRYRTLAITALQAARRAKA